MCCIDWRQPLITVLSSCTRKLRSLNNGWLHTQLLFIPIHVIPLSSYQLLYWKNSFSFSDVTVANQDNLKEIRYLINQEDWPWFDQWNAWCSSLISYHLDKFFLKLTSGVNHNHQHGQKLVMEGEAWQTKVLIDVSTHWYPRQ